MGRAWWLTVPIAMFCHLPGTWGLIALTRLVYLSVLMEQAASLISIPSPCSWGGWWGLRTGPGTKASIANTGDHCPRFLPTLGDLLGSVVGIVGPEGDRLCNPEGIHLWEL